MRLQEKLVALRKAQKLSQDDVAEQLNVTRQAISRWESGKSVPSTENLIAIAALFQVPLPLLVDDAASLAGGQLAGTLPEAASAAERPVRSRGPALRRSMQSIFSGCILVLLVFTTLGVHTLLTREPIAPAAAAPWDNTEGMIELLDDANRQEIGQETVVTFGGQSPQASPKPAISFVEGSDILLPSLVQAVKTERTKTPELMAPNGVMGIFTRDDGSGWSLRAGETLFWSFEKYPFSDGRQQTLAVGHIKNGTLCRSTLYDGESGRYQVQAGEDGTYAIYFICCSSDRISLKEGTIGIKS